MMGETACFMQPFSYASGVGLPRECDEQHIHLEGNPMNALTQSISFGRFVTESVSWDRWSVFPSNRYVEEAEKFSRPGSVAQKKAFFEAHYKEMAERKKAAAAALLEQANIPVSTEPVQSECEIWVADYSSSKNGWPADNLNYDNKDVTAVESRDHVRGKLQHMISEVDVTRSSTEIEKTESEIPGKSETNHIDREDRVADLAVEEKIFREFSVNDEPVNQVKASDHCEEVGDRGSSGSPEMEKPLLQDFVCQEVLEDPNQKKPAFACSKILRRQKASSGVMPSPAVAASTPLPCWKGNNVTPTSRKSPTVNPLGIKRPTPKRLPLGNLTPVRETSKATISRRIGSDKTFGGSTKDCPTPSKTPTVAPANASLKYTLATPKSESKRTPVGEGRQTGSKRRSLAKECSKFLSACKNKMQSPSLSTPFRLRTEERAARRKAKLEEKFDADEREKIQLQNLLKEREEMEVKKFRQTLCFKARPLPKFYRESVAAVKSPTKEVETNTSELSKRNRKLWSSTTVPKGGVSPQLHGKRPVLDVSLRNNPARENRSPNIRQ